MDTEELAGRVVTEVIDGREYTTAALCAAVRISPTTLRRYRAAGIVAPLNPEGRWPRYDELAVLRVRTARRLMRDLGVNLAGAEVALRLLDQLAALRVELACAQAQLDLVHRGFSHSVAR